MLCNFTTQTALHEITKPITSGAKTFTSLPRRFQDFQCRTDSLKFGTPFLRVHALWVLAKGMVARPKKAATSADSITPLGL
jgi:hypothetical protein